MFGHIKHCFYSAQKPLIWTNASSWPLTCQRKIEVIMVKVYEEGFDLMMSNAKAHPLGN